MRRSGALALPYAMGLFLLVFIPACAALFLGFTEFTGVEAPRFNGFANFRRLAGDEAFRRALGNSAIYVLIAIPLRIAAAVGAALLLARRGPFVGGARAVAYLPTVVPDVAYALLWFWLLNPLFGPFAPLFDLVGDPLTQPWAARVALPVMAAFQIGEGFVVALAARRAIPGTLYEAAAVDGASPLFALSRITLPLMAPVIGLLALRDLVLSLQVNFVPALLITEGGPRYATTYVPVYVYRAAFRYFRLGYASTLSIVMFAITALIVLAQYRLIKRWRARTT